MAGAPSYAHIKADVLAVVATVPRGKVTTPTAIGSCLGVMPRHVSTVVAGLEAAERDVVPWHRVVADGGAVGRHPRRDEQIARLRADGLTVSPAGIVAGLDSAMLAGLAKPRAGGRPGAAIAEAEPRDPQHQAPEAERPSRARGRFDRPETKLSGTKLSGTKLSGTKPG